MALVYTPPGELGVKCPDFHLRSVDGRTFSRDDFTSRKALVVMFICNHCPYVRAVEERILALARSYRPQDVAFVAICSNDPSEYPEDAPNELLKRSQEMLYPFPYLIDEDQLVAQEFAAVCTPDFFVFDQELTLRYRGRLDDSWKNPSTVRRQELKSALDLICEGKTVADQQNPSMGCSIKWKNK